MPGDKLTDPLELLFRHVNPAFVVGGRPSKQAFCPTTKDEGLLSVDRGSLTTAEAAHELYTSATGLGLKCDGTWALTVSECTAEALPALSDPMKVPPEKVANGAHAVVDFTALGRKDRERKGVVLARLAVARRRVHPPAVADANDASGVVATDGARADSADDVSRTGT
jgi:hypothetical protein